MVARNRRVIRMQQVVHDVSLDPFDQWRQAFMAPRTSPQGGFGDVAPLRAQISWLAI